MWVKENAVGVVSQLHAGCGAWGAGLRGGVGVGGSGGGARDCREGAEVGRLFGVSEKVKKGWGWVLWV